MDKIAYISNTCISTNMYKIFSVQYNHPFVGSLFVNDEQYIKFCQKFDYYINCTPIFGDPNENSIWAKQNSGVWYKHKDVTSPYIVMYLDDVEIHWVHETDMETTLNSYNRRLERYRTYVDKVYFILSCAEIMNDHTEEKRHSLLNDFQNINNSIYVSKTPSELGLYNNNIIILYEPWINTSNERNESHTYNFNDQKTIAETILKYLYLQGAYN